MDIMKQYEKQAHTLFKEQLELDCYSLTLNKGIKSYIQAPIQNKCQQIHTKRECQIVTCEKSPNKRFIAIGYIDVENDESQLNIYLRQKLVKSLRYQCGWISCVFAIDNLSIYIALSHPLRLLELSILDGFQLIRESQTGIFDCDNLIEFKYPSNKFLILKQSQKIVIYSLLTNEFNLIIQLKDDIWGFDCINNLSTQIVCSQKDYMLSFFNNKQLEFQQRIVIQEDEFEMLHAGLITLKFFGLHNKIAGTTSCDLIIWSIDHDKKCFTQDLIIKGNDFYYNLEFCPQIIIIVYYKQTYAYKLQKDNQNQVNKISLCNRVKLINDVGKYAQKKYNIQSIK